MAIILGTPVVGTTVTTSFTNGASTSTVIVGVSGQAGAAWAPTATYNASVMSLVKATTDGSTVGAALFSMQSPPTGAHDVVISNASGLLGLRVFIVEVSQNDSGILGAFSVGLSASLTTTLNCTAFNGVVFDVRSISNHNSYTVGAGQTQLFNADLAVAGDVQAVASYEPYTSGSVVMDWTGTAPSSVWRVVVEVKGITPTAYTLTAGSGSFLMTFWNAVLRTYVFINTSKPTTSITNDSKPSTSITNDSKPSTTIVNDSKPNL